MILTNQFIFLHMFRSGGTTVNNVLIEHMDGTMLGYHRARKEIPAELRTLPLIGTIRNPWDWYVSVYHHAINFSYPKGANTFLNWLVDFHKMSFKEVMLYLLRVKEVPHYQKTIRYFPDVYEWNTIKLDNITKADYISYHNSGMSFWSWLIEHMYSIEGKIDGVSWCKTSELHREFYTVLESFVGEKPEIKKLLSTQRLNAMTGYNSYLRKNVAVPRKKNYRYYYDDELREHVYEKDYKYIQYFGFVF
ncbi:hypothetical protein [Candidatus Uabimicrobium amorphum]|uniref:Sulfotransferase domain-containing protein n=1 Tax=Uabimicrobium amorphum TaxID=2596890 RepID=A0A5S9IU49_UABAM|nr:hypothetical protein [Candidatus Uabimicrobium amorphum]BBM87200.1 hypothetical protein UABAM_05603 [Candidatus Uabimicrobium amorphum]